MLENNVFVKKFNPKKKVKKKKSYWWLSYTISSGKPPKLFPLFQAFLKNPSIAALSCKENVLLEGGFNSGIQTIPNLIFSWGISIPNSIFSWGIGHIRSKSKSPGEKFPKYLLHFMDKCQDCAESLHLLEPPGLYCSLKLCQNSKYILNFMYCGPPSPPLEVQLFRYCSNPRTWMGFLLSPT